MKVCCAKCKVCRLAPTKIMKGQAHKEQLKSVLEALEEVKVFYSSSSVGDVVEKDAITKLCQDIEKYYHDHIVITKF